jgi:hypothetical protein
MPLSNWNSGVKVGGWLYLTIFNKMAGKKREMPVDLTCRFATFTPPFIRIFR